MVTDHTVVQLNIYSHENKMLKMFIKHVDFAVLTPAFFPIHIFIALSCLPCCCCFFAVILRCFMCYT